MQMIPIVKLYLLLFKEFFKIGIFSFGGGYATLPFLYDLSLHYDWFSSAELSKMIALSAVTPGPVGINVATYAGLKIYGLPSAFIATIAETIPAFIFVILTYKFIEKYKNSKIIQGILYSLRPTSCALLSYVCIKLGYNNFILNSSFSLCGLTIFIILLSISFYKNIGAVFYMFLAVIIGYLYKLII